MLVLSRRPDSSIIVGHDITVTVEYVAGDDVCLKVEGPEDLQVRRVEEVEVADILSKRGRVWDASSMHVLSKRSRPALLLNGEILVAVQSVSNESVRIGIEAPPHVLIYREEVYRQMQDANRGALNDPSGDLVGLSALRRQSPSAPIA